MTVEIFSIRQTDTHEHGDQIQEARSAAWGSKTEWTSDEKLKTCSHRWSGYEIFFHFRDDDGINCRTAVYWHLTIELKLCYPERFLISFDSLIIRAATFRWGVWEGLSYYLGNSVLVTATANDSRVALF
jgi:hypothetical protein